jgi:6-pyruvoyltetrahydropterin/6-carboxytetrahydropterin synthase
VYRVTRRYRFSASHRLHAPQLNERENRELYGKCNNPYGHGHNYAVEVTARGPLDDSGRALDTSVLDELVEQQVMAPFDHRNLNLDGNAFEHLVPTSENLAVEICRRLQAHWSTAFPGEWPQLEQVRIAETDRNIFVVRAQEIPQAHEIK